MDGDGLLDRLRRWFRPTPADVADRVALLDGALARDPDNAALYLSRGEALAELGEYGRAAEDFRRAAQLADGQLKTKPWGVVAQVVRDRALRGLKQAQAEASAGNRGGER